MKPTSLEQLRKRASKSTAPRGHRMKWSPPSGRPPVPHLGAPHENYSQTGTCIRCGKQVRITQCPPSDGIAISGEATATNCGTPPGDLDYKRLEWSAQAKAHDDVARLKEDRAERNRKAGYDAAAKQLEDQAANYRASARALRDQAHPGKRCWEVFSGAASWHQRQAGHAYACSIRFMKTEAELHEYLDKLKARGEVFRCVERLHFDDNLPNKQ